MYTEKEINGVRFLTEWRLCCICKRMFNRNITPHQMGQTRGIIAYGHLVCPPMKPEHLRLEKPK